VRSSALLGWNSDQGQPLVSAAFNHREQKHDGRQCTLRAPVTVVHPEPLIAVMHGGKGVRRFVLAAMDIGRVPVRCNTRTNSGSAAPVAPAVAERLRTPFKDSTVNPSTKSAA